MTLANATFAFDKKSARSFDADGRMRVRDCVISVAEVNPYYGKEIPRRAELALDANTVYDLYRDPEELARGAASFNGLPLMIRHIAQTADEPRKEYIGGSVGNARFANDQLIADLLVWDKKAIEYIQSGELADLSSSYRYTPQMSPGEYNGRRYDGRMTNIEGNHVALVEDGRATGAHVADSALNSPTGATDVDPNETPAVAPTGSADVAQALMLLTSKLETIETRLTAIEGGKEETPQSEAEVGIPASVNTASDADPDEDDKDEKDKPAMDAKTVQAVVDAAVKAERLRAQSVEDAKRNCRGDLGDMIAMDDAGQIYRAALKQRGVDVASIPTGAEQATYQAIQRLSQPQRTVMANDSNTAAPMPFDTKRIRNLGQ